MLIFRRKLFHPFSGRTYLWPGYVWRCCGPAEDHVQVVAHHNPRRGDHTQPCARHCSGRLKDEGVILHSLWGGGSFFARSFYFFCSIFVFILLPFFLILFPYRGVGIPGSVNLPVGNIHKTPEPESRFLLNLALENFKKHYTGI
jgi:hypothetical protein